MAQVLYPYDEAGRVLRAWRDLTPQLPDIVAGVYAGAPGDATAALAPLARLGTPLTDLGATVSYVDVQSALDAAFPAGGRYFFKSHFMDALTDQAIEALLACDAHRPNPESLIVIRTLGGAIARVADDESAYPHRHARYNLSIDAGWFDPALDAAAIGWSRSSWDAMAPFATGGVYLNFAGLDDEADRSAVFGRSAFALARSSGS